MDRTVDFSDEEICSVEANGACEEPECQYHQHCVSKIQKSRNKTSDLQLQRKKTKMFTRKFC